MSLLHGVGSGLGGAGDSGGALGSFFSTTVDNSLRLNSDSSYLTFTQGTATDISKWTVNFWLKRAHPLDDSSDYDAVFGVDGPGTTGLAFLGGKLYLFINYDTGGSQARLITNRVFRDPSAWYNFHVTFDRANGTAAQRLRLYVNGVEETSFSTDERSSITSSSSSGWNVSGLTAAINRRSGAVNSRYHNGYFAQFYNIDGAVVAPTEFAETKDGVWIPKEYSGSYGNNGWLLEFKQTGTGTASSSTVGADTSGNNNHWTSSGVFAHDVMLDSPTNNFAVLNSLDATIGSPTISEGNLRISNSGSGYDGTYATIAVTSGKWYAEFLYISGDNRGFFGIAREERLSYVNSGSYLGNILDTYGLDFRARAYTGTNATSSSGVQLFDQTNFDTGDIGLLCFDVDAGKLWFGRRDVSGSTTIWYDSSGNNNGDPSAGSNPTYTFTATGSTWFIGCHDYAGTELMANFGQDGSFAGNITSQGASDANGIGDFNYIESGFLALCTSNLPDITIGPGQDSQADDHFDTLLYTGDGNTGLEVNGLNFQPDFLWIKRRDSSQNFSNALLNSVTGATKGLYSNRTNSEFTSSGTNDLQSFDNDGFTIGPSNQFSGNDSGGTFVAWSWKAGGAPTADNSAGNGATPTAGSVKIDGSNLGSALAGSLAATRLSANTTAGFSIVTWDASGVSSGTVAHGLTVAPDIIIAKPRDFNGTNWFVQVPDVLANTNMLNLETTGASYNPGYNHFNDTVPTDEVFSFGGYLGGHSDGGGNDLKIAYCFHSVSGYSSVGSYIGNNSTDGPFVFTGFRPAFLLLKRTNGAASWLIYDDKRDTYNQMQYALFPNLANGEYTSNLLHVDFLSNGFKIRNATYGETNASSGAYIYLAFAEAPFKFANAR